MVLEYLSGGRIQGTDSETRLKNLFANAYTGITKESHSMVGDGDGGVKSSTPINGQNSLYFDPQDYDDASVAFTTYIGNIGTTATTWKELPKSDFSVSMWLRYNTTTPGEAGYEAHLYSHGQILGNAKANESETKRIGNSFGIGIKSDSSEKFYVHLAGGGNSNQVALDKYYSGGSDALRDDKWHFYVFTFDNSNSLLSIYRDANSTAVDTQAYAVTITANTNSPTTFDVGRHGAGNGNGLRQVYVNDVGIWNKILTNSEMSLLFNSYDPDSATSSSNTGKNIKDSGVDTSSCLVWWKMGDHAGAGVSDGFDTSAVAATEVPISDVPAGTRLEVTDTRKIYRRKAGGNPTGTAYGVSTAAFKQYLDYTSFDDRPHAVQLKPDGTKMFVMDYEGREIRQFTLSTAYDVTTATSDGTLDVSNEDISPTGLFIDSSGSHLFITGRNQNKIDQYSLGTSWTVTTNASYVRTANAGWSNLWDLTFKPDGTKMYVLDGGEIEEYTLGSAWNISSLSNNVTFDPDTQDNNAFAMQFNGDGTKCFITGNENDKIYRYTLSTAYSFSSVSYDGSSHDFQFPSSPDDYRDTSGFWFANSGKKLYVATGESATNRILEYDLLDTSTWVEKGTA